MMGRDFAFLQALVARQQPQEPITNKESQESQASQASQESPGPRAP